MKLTRKIDLSPLLKATTPGHALCQLAAAITHYDRHVTLAEYTELAVFANNLAELTESASVASYLILQSLDKKITYDQALARLRTCADQMDLTTRRAILDLLQPLVALQHEDRAKLACDIAAAIGLPGAAPRAEEQPTPTGWLTPPTDPRRVLPANRRSDALKTFALVYQQHDLLRAIVEEDAETIARELECAKHSVLSELQAYLRLLEQQEANVAQQHLTRVTDAYKQQMDLRLQSVDQRIASQIDQIKDEVREFRDTVADSILLALREEMDLAAWEESEFWSLRGEIMAETLIDEKLDRFHRRYERLLGEWQAELDSLGAEMTALQHVTLRSMSMSGAGRLIEPLSLGIRGKILGLKTAKRVRTVGTIGIMGTLGLAAAGVVNVTVLLSPPGLAVAAATALAAFIVSGANPSKWKRGQLHRVERALKKKLEFRLTPVIKELEERLSRTPTRFQEAIDEALRPIVLESALIEEVDRLQRKLIVRYANEQIRQINKLSVSSNWMKFLENRRNRTASEER